MDSHAIENMLQITNGELDKIFEKLLDLGIMEVVCICCDVQLTTKGVRSVKDSAKKLKIKYQKLQLQ
jgi:helix-turn-helix protein